MSGPCNVTQQHRQLSPVRLSGSPVILPPRAKVNLGLTQKAHMGMVVSYTILGRGIKCIPPVRLPGEAQ